MAYLEPMKIDYGYPVKNPYAFTNCPGLERKSLEELIWDSKGQSPPPCPGSALSDASTAPSWPSLPSTPDIIPAGQQPRSPLTSPIVSAPIGYNPCLVKSLESLLREAQPESVPCTPCTASQSQAPPGLAPFGSLVESEAEADPLFLQVPPGLFRPPSVQSDRGEDLTPAFPLAPPPGLPPAIASIFEEGATPTQTPTPSRAVMLNLTESLGLWSAGAAAHEAGTCQPCGFVWKGGCTNGANCEFCHLCPPDEIKRRKKEKVAKRKLELKWQEMKCKMGMGDEGEGRTA